MEKFDINPVENQNKKRVDFDVREFYMDRKNPETEFGLQEEFNFSDEELDQIEGLTNEWIQKINIEGVNPTKALAETLKEGGEITENIAGFLSTLVFTRINAKYNEEKGE